MKNKELTKYLLNGTTSTIELDRRAAQIARLEKLVAELTAHIFKTDFSDYFIKKHGTFPFKAELLDERRALLKEVSK